MRRTRSTVLAALAVTLGGALSVTAPSTASGASRPSAASRPTPRPPRRGSADRVADYWTTEPDARRQGAGDARPRPARRPATVERGTATRSRPRSRAGPDPAASAVATTGKVFFTLGGVNYVCSGTATSSTNRDVVTTAGHCVNEGPGAFATNWAFVPAYNNGSRPYGTWTARTLVTTSAWANQGDINYDGGFAVMNTLDGQHLTDVVGGQGIGFNLART